MIRLEKEEKVAVLGIGNEFRGDDAAGLLVARKLAPLSGERVLVLEGGCSPENFTGALRRFSPSLVLMIDCLDFGGKPGGIHLLDASKIRGSTFSTHNPSLALLAEYLKRELGTKVLLIGIQPKQLSGAPSGEVLHAVDKVASLLEGALRILETSFPHGPST
ncbi:MAG: hydrogenase 3 maturation endopeptidase HyCI [Candidatus Hadarchaeales archaeon]